MASIHLGSLEKAIASLEAGLERALAEPDDDIPRDATIQRFEFTYELAWKTLKRHLAATEPNAGEVDRFSFNDLIRRGCERGLVRAELRVWADFRRLRGTTSHIYDSEKAAEVFAAIPDFLVEVRDLLKKLKAA